MFTLILNLLKNRIDCINFQIMPVFLLLSFSKVQAQINQTYLLKANRAQMEQINWPTVYPERFKLSASPFFLSGTSTGEAQARGYGLSLGGELIFYQVVSAGAGYEWAFLPEGDGNRAAHMHRLQLLSSLIIQLDKPERHHLLLLFRPGLGLVSAPSGGFFAAGFNFGLAYEYTLNADYTLMPEFLWQRYGGSTEKGLGLRGWTFGLRLNFGR